MSKSSRDKGEAASQNHRRHREEEEGNADPNAQIDPSKDKKAGLKRWVEKQFAKLHLNDQPKLRRPATSSAHRQVEVHDNPGAPFDDGGFRPPTNLRVHRHFYPVEPNLQPSQHQFHHSQQHYHQEGSYGTHSRQTSNSPRVSFHRPPYPLSNTQYRWSAANQGATVDQEGRKIISPMNLSTSSSLRFSYRDPTQQQQLERASSSQERSISPFVRDLPDRCIASGRVTPSPRLTRPEARLAHRVDLHDSETTLRPVYSSDDDDDDDSDEGLSKKMPVRPHSVAATRFSKSFGMRMGVDYEEEDEGTRGQTQSELTPSPPGSSITSNQSSQKSQQPQSSQEEKRAAIRNKNEGVDAIQNDQRQLPPRPLSAIPSTSAIKWSQTLESPTMGKTPAEAIWVELDVTRRKVRPLIERLDMRKAEITLEQQHDFTSRLRQTLMRHLVQTMTRKESFAAARALDKLCFDAEIDFNTGLGTRIIVDQLCTRVMQEPLMVPPVASILVRLTIPFVDCLLVHAVLDRHAAVFLGGSGSGGGGAAVSRVSRSAMQTGEGNEGGVLAAPLAALRLLFAVWARRAIREKGDDDGKKDVVLTARLLWRQMVRTVRAVDELANGGNPSQPTASHRLQPSVLAPVVLYALLMETANRVLDKCYGRQFEKVLELLSRRVLHLVRVVLVDGGRHHTSTLVSPSSPHHPDSVTRQRRLVERLGVAGYIEQLATAIEQRAWRQKK